MLFRTLLCVCLLVLFTQLGRSQYFAGTNRSSPHFIPIRDSLYEMAEQIQVGYLREHLDSFASDAFRGRAFNMPDNTKAAHYLASELKKLGVRPGNGQSYYQRIEYHRIFWDKIQLKQEQAGRVVKSYVHKRDFYTSYKQNPKPLDTVLQDLIMLDCIRGDGGIRLKPRKVHLQGKAVALRISEISGASGSAPAAPLTSLPDYTEVLKELKKAGVVFVFIVEPELSKRVYSDNALFAANTLEMGRWKLPVEFPNHVYVAASVVDRIFRSRPPNWWTLLRARICRRSISSTSLVYPLHVIQRTTVLDYSGDNVLAYFPGIDSLEESIVVTAHMDHLPPLRDRIFNGADDNGSGSIGVLAIACALRMAEKKGIRPKKSILLMWTNGEERGLLGSKYYTTHPIFPMEHTLAEINIDMIGRVTSDWSEDSSYLYVVGSDRISPLLHTINEAVNEKYSNLTLDYRFNAADDPNRYYFRSDHYHFAEQGIPSIFFFNGVHEDYHRPTDTVEKIVWPVYVRRVRHVFSLLWTLASRPAPLLSNSH